MPYLFQRRCSSIIKKAAVIVILSIYLISFSACITADVESVNLEFKQNIYKKSSIFASIFDSNGGYDEIYKIVYSAAEDNYYASFYDSKELKERLDIYDKNFNFIKTVKGGLEELDPDRATLFAFDVDKENNIYLIKYAEGAPAAGRVLVIFDKSGKLTGEIKIEDAKNIIYDAVINDLFITDDNFVFVSPWGIQITDKTGKTIKEITNADRSRYVLSAESDGVCSLYVSCYGGILKKINISDGKEIWSVTETNGYPVNKISYSRQDKQICVYKTNVLSLYSTNGDFLGDICDLRDFSPAYENMDIKNYASGIVGALSYKNNENIVFIFHAFSQENIFFETVKLEALDDGEYKKILEGRGDAQDLKKTVKILLPYYDGVNEDLVYEYNKNRPDVYIETKYFAQESKLYNPFDYAQYVAMRLNTGEADWDIVYNAFIPYDIYAAKGYFAELDELDTDEVFKDTKRYFTNITDALRDKNGKMYLFPTQISFFVFESLKTPPDAGFSSWRDITGGGGVKFYETGLNNTFIFEYLFSRFISTEYENIFFDREKFFKVLDIFTKLDGGSFYTDDSQNADFAIQFVSNISAAAYEPKYSLYIMPFDIDGSDSLKYKFNASGFLICSKSTVKQEAFDFIKYISENTAFLGISRNKFKTELETYKTEIQKITAGFDLEQEKYKIKTDRFIEDISKIYENLNYSPMIPNIDLNRLLHEQLIKYLGGSVTKEDFAVKIENFLWLYENEEK